MLDTWNKTIYITVSLYREVFLLLLLLYNVHMYTYNGPAL